MTDQTTDIAQELDAVLLAYAALKVDMRRLEHHIDRLKDKVLAASLETPADVPAPEASDEARRAVGNDEVTFEELEEWEPGIKARAKAFKIVFGHLPMQSELRKLRAVPDDQHGDLMRLLQKAEITHPKHLDAILAELPDPEASESAETPEAEPEDTEVAESAGIVITGPDGKLYSTEPRPEERQGGQLIVDNTEMPDRAARRRHETHAIEGDGQAKTKLLAGMDARESNPTLFLTAPESEEASK